MFRAQAVIIRLSFSPNLAPEGRASNNVRGRIFVPSQRWQACACVAGNVLSACSNNIWSIEGSRIDCHAQ